MNSQLKFKHKSLFKKCQGSRGFLKKVMDLWSQYTTVVISSSLYSIFLKLNVVLSIFKIRSVIMGFEKIMEKKYYMGCDKVDAVIFLFSTAILSFP